MRDYGTGSWVGGNESCDHSKPTTTYNQGFNERWGRGAGDKKQERKNDGQYAQTCGKCGARRVDQQLGLEPTPDQYVENMVGVFREVRRVLRQDGTLWLNIGDSYSQGGYAGDDAPTNKRRIEQGSGMDGNFRFSPRVQERQGGEKRQRKASDIGLKPKDLCGIPWRLAFALQQDGWYLRSEIIWAKPNPMPESVMDRPTKAHEQVFLLTKSARYFYDADAVREPHVNGDGWIGRSRAQSKSDGDPFVNSGGHRAVTGDPAGRNLRSVWNIPTEPYPDAHFATFPQALVEPCVKAGCPEGGVVLDPFMGSGTVAHVCRRLGRRSIGIELNPEYAKLAARRLQQQSLFATV